MVTGVVWSEVVVDPRRVAQPGMGILLGKLVQLLPRLR
jgi:hypothetical protein